MPRYTTCINYFIAIVAFLTFAQFVYLDEFRVRSFDETMLTLTRCGVRMNVPLERADQYRKLDFPNDTQTRCFLKCALLNLDIFYKEKGFVVDATVAQLRSLPVKEFFGGNLQTLGINITADQIEEYQKKLKDDPEVVAKINKCNKDGKHSDPCYWAYNGFTCAVREIRALLKI